MFVLLRAVRSSAPSRGNDNAGPWCPMLPQALPADLVSEWEAAGRKNE